MKTSLGEIVNIVNMWKEMLRRLWCLIVILLFVRWNVTDLT